MTELTLSDIKRTAAGVRYVRPYLGTNKVTGKPLRPYRSFPDATSDEEALEQARQWQGEVLEYARHGVSRRVGDLLALYVRYGDKSRFSSDTVATYRTLSSYAEPIWHMAVRDVKESDVERLYHRLLTDGTARGVVLSNNTVITLHWFLSGAWRWMERMGLADRNPVKSAEKPAPGMYEAHVLDSSALKVLRAALREQVASDAGTRAERLRRETAFAAYLALRTGLRRGEVCALRRKDVRMASRDITVRGTVIEVHGVRRQRHTKGRKSRNVSVGDDTLRLIREHEATVARERGRRWPDSPLVTVSGELVRPSQISREFRRICDELGLPPEITFHSLRHTHATWLISRGVDMKTVSARLGHSSVNTTMTIYAHVLPGSDAEAAAAFERMEREDEEW